MKNRSMVVIRLCGHLAAVRILVALRPYDFVRRFFGNPTKPSDIFQIEIVRRSHGSRNSDVKYM